MNIDKLTMKAQEAIQQTQNNAIALGNQQIDGEHLHLALLQQQSGLIPKLISNMGKDPAALTRAVEEELNKLPKVQGSGDSMYTSTRFSKLLMDAEKIADRFGQSWLVHIDIVPHPRHGCNAIFVKCKRTANPC